MNERIEQLAVEARQYAFGEVENSQDPTEWSTKYYNEMFEQKFAELIVKECAAQCWTVSELEHKGDVVYQCSKRIRKHFGVEE